MGIFIDFLIILVMSLFIFIGYKKGLIKVALSFVAIIASIIIALVFYRPIASQIIDNTTADEKIADGIYGQINNVDFENWDKENNEKQPILKMSEKYIKEAMDQSKQDVARYVAEQLSRTIVEGITFIALLIVLRIALIALNLLSDIIAGLPIIKQFNKSGGIIYGIVEGFFIINLLLAIAFVLNPIVLDGKIEQNINESHIGKVVYQNNILISSVVK